MFWYLCIHHGAVILCLNPECIVISWDILMLHQQIKRKLVDWLIELICLIPHLSNIVHQKQCMIQSTAFCWPTRFCLNSSVIHPLKKKIQNLWSGSSVFKESAISDIYKDQCHHTFWCSSLDDVVVYVVCQRIRMILLRHHTLKLSIFLFKTSVMFHISYV